MPVDLDDRVYIVERHVESHADSNGLVTEYAQRSEACGMSPIRRTLQTADEFVDVPIDRTLSG